MLDSLVGLFDPYGITARYIKRFVKDVNRYEKQQTITDVVKSLESFISPEGYQSTYEHEGKVQGKMQNIVPEGSEAWERIMRASDENTKRFLAGKNG